MVSSEVVPYAKTGGLADVVGALAIEFARLGHDVIVVLPRYRQVRSQGYKVTDYVRLSVPTSQGHCDVNIQEIAAPASPVSETGRLRVFAVRHDQAFDRPGLYQEAGEDYPDNCARFVLFCRAVMELLVHLCDEGG